eukprot:TRINITY_DN57216_c0_g1_i1.p1 TRINITY_DN57216_c0_g1~~TRINITY_DN57216_c0_g1_i1.p1  ORF type:complete len:356 (-),score=61.66 TRINITY_DN57216_c0_g1_i1:303-1370(-)
MWFFFFKQKTAYEMLRSLVGSEMCIRDSNRDEWHARSLRTNPPTLQDGVLAAVDAHNGGTWLALNPELGTVVVLLNVTGHPAAGSAAGGRGVLPPAVAKDPTAAVRLLEGRKSLPGFNLLWCNNVRDPSLRVRYATNCDPADAGHPAPAPIEELPRGVVLAVGNDLMGDEHVKCPHAGGRLRTALSGLPSDSSSPERVREAAAGAFADRDAPMSWWRPENMRKLFLSSSRRRPQPARKTMLSAVLVSCVLGLGLLWARGWADTLVDAVCGMAMLVLVGFGIGIWHHQRMQALMLNVPGSSWRTISQTVVAVNKLGEIYYWYREVSDRMVPRRWQEERFDQVGTRIHHQYDPTRPQ